MSVGTQGVPCRKFDRLRRIEPRAGGKEERKRRTAPLPSPSGDGEGDRGTRWRGRAERGRRRRRACRRCSARLRRSAPSPPSVVLPHPRDGGEKRRSLPKPQPCVRRSRRPSRTPIRDALRPDPSGQPPRAGRVKVEPQARLRHAGRLDAPEHGGPPRPLLSKGVEVRFDPSRTSATLPSNGRLWGKLLGRMPKDALAPDQSLCAAPQGRRRRGASLNSAVARRLRADFPPMPACLRLVRSPPSTPAGGDRRPAQDRTASQRNIERSLRGPA